MSVKSTPSSLWVGRLFDGGTAFGFALRFRLMVMPRDSLSCSRPIAAVQRPVLYRFGDVSGTDVFSGVKVGDGARDFQNTVVGAGAQAQARHGAFKQALAVGGNIAIFADLPRAHLRVRINFLALIPFQLAVARLHHTLANLGGGFAAGIVAQLAIFYRGHVNMDIDAVKQRPGDF